MGWGFQQLAHITQLISVSKTMILAWHRLHLLRPNLLQPLIFLFFPEREKFGPNISGLLPDIRVHTNPFLNFLILCTSYYKYLGF